MKSLSNKIQNKKRSVCMKKFKGLVSVVLTMALVISLAFSSLAATKTVPALKWGNSILDDKQSAGWKVSGTKVTQKELGTKVMWHQIFAGKLKEDYTVTAKVKLVKNGTTSKYPKCGIIACYQDRNNFVTAWLDSKYNYFAVFGKDSSIDRGWVNYSNVPGTADDHLSKGFDFKKAHEIKVTKKGYKFTFYLDGKKVGEKVFAIDNGQIGLITEDCQAEFTDVTIK